MILSLYITIFKQWALNESQSKSMENEFISKILWAVMTPVTQQLLKQSTKNISGFSLWKT